MTLEPGDVIATGTPAGVAPIVPGDRVEVEITGIGVLENTVEIASP
jgi:2-keto-4-pentenoate hydratase/2-oxohepta-3-ene-1,7-dioic acid hydratase in catechol pathway